MDRDHEGQGVIATTDGVPIDGMTVGAYRIPTDAPESDGTSTWDGTTLVVVEVSAGGRTGLGYTYAHQAAATLIREHLADIVVGEDALATRARWFDLVHTLRNLARAGLASHAISAVDTALWDLKARFTSYDDDRPASQLVDWVGDGIPRVKMKVGRELDRDLERVRAPREAIGADAELYVEWFHDHVRIERELFDGALEPQDGHLVPDRSRSRHGLALKRADAEPYRIA